jgi:GDP-4-dehydro-6-deoxy-D-mannose reductase
MKKALITGISGFVGKHLAEHLLTTNEYEIVGTYRSEKGLEKLGELKKSIQCKQLDLLDAQAVSELIVSYQPEHIYHLAAMSSAGESHKTPDTVLTNNVLSELHILDTLKNNNMKQTRVLIVSSAEVYGFVDAASLPITEKTELRPTSPYAVSKITQDYLALQYYLAYHIDVIRVRPFNHIGSGHSPIFALSSFAKQIAEIEKGQLEPVLKVGNLASKRDFTDVADTVKAYELLMKKGVSGEVYNIGSGKSYQMKELLEILLSFSEKKITTEQDPEKFRPIDIPDFVCDYSKLHELTGWEPEIPIEKTLQKILDYWRKVV